jgi:hypothetical protein
MSLRAQFATGGGHAIADRLTAGIPLFFLQDAGLVQDLLEAF